MLTAQELIEEVKTCVLGASFTDDAILRLLNRGQFRIAGVVLLPELSASGTVITDADQPYANLPVDYHRELQEIRGASGQTVKYYGSWLEFVKYHPQLDALGSSVSCASIRGRMLYYQPLVPSTETLTLYYHRQPTPMVIPDIPEETDQIYPDGIPAHLADDLLINFAARELWKDIEQDDNAQPNTTQYDRRFNSAMAELMLFCEPDGKPIYIQDNWGLS